MNAKKREGGGEPIHDLEQQFILRLPAVNSLNVGFKRSLERVIACHCLCCDSCVIIVLLFPTLNKAYCIVL